MHEGKAITRRIVLSAEWQQILDYTEQRVAAILSVPNPDVVYLCFGHPSDGPLEPGQGHPLTNTNSPLNLSAFLGLRLAHGPVYASALVAGVEIIVTEILVGPTCRDRLNPYGG
jgi:hypothetical protein